MTKGCLAAVFQTHSHEKQLTVIFSIEKSQTKSIHKRAFTDLSAKELN